MNFSEIAHKKVAGVPVLYLAGAAVTVLAVVAWRMKAVPDTTTDTAPAADNGTGGADDPSNAGGLAGMDDASYGGFNTNGTVVVQPQASTPTPTEPEIPDNATWSRKSAEWLVAQKKATGTEAYAALSKYLDGEDLTFDQGALVNAAIAEKGQPPDPVGKIGIVNEAPAKKQFTTYPGKHTVKGNNDNNAYRLAALYYGVPVENSRDANRIVEMNLSLGTASTTYPVGTVVTIPAKIPVTYFTATASVRSFAAISSKNGLSVAQLQALNPGVVNPVNVGTKVRIR